MPMTHAGIKSAANTYGSDTTKGRRAPFYRFTNRFSNRRRAIPGAGARVQQEDSRRTARYDFENSTNHTTLTR